MRIALVHDYLNEMGGAERVLKVLADMYPNAPIYTAFSVKGSTAQIAFKDREIRESWLAPILKIGKLYSPLRFLTPIIWKTMDLTDYDLVITSASWYITRGFKVGLKTKVICYCHTPPRWLYGHETSVGFKKWWPVRAYALIVGHFLRTYDFKVSQEINHWVANSKNVQARIKKFYRKGSIVIYPPIDIKKIIQFSTTLHRGVEKKRKYFLIVSRLVGAKGLEEAVKAFKDSKYRLRIVGEKSGYSEVEKRLQKISGDVHLQTSGALATGGQVELMGRVEDNELWKMYAKAKGFIALARDEDFGMTVVEAQAAGTPVIAFNGGGFKESVVDGKTGVLISDTDEKTIKEAIKRFNKIKWDKKVLQKNARRFSKEKFIENIKLLVNKHA